MNCKTCKQEKEETDFYTCNKGRSLHTSCKICYSARQMTNYQANRSARLIKMKEWQQQNRELYAASRKNYTSNRNAVDPLFKLARNLRARLNVALKLGYKAGSAVTDLGCSIEQLKNHLQTQFAEGMSWDNYGQWQIDHKLPLSKFNLANAIEFKKAVHFTNLQPLWARDNQSKGNR